MGAVGLIGDRGESARLKVAAMGDVGCGLDSNSTTKFKISIFGVVDYAGRSSLERVSATATSLSSSSAALLARAREMYLRNAGPVDSSILSTFVFLFG